MLKPSIQLSQYEQKFGELSKESCQDYTKQKGRPNYGGKASSPCIYKKYDSLVHFWSLMITTKTRYKKKLT